MSYLVAEPSFVFGKRWNITIKWSEIKGNDETDIIALYYFNKDSYSDLNVDDYFLFRYVNESGDGWFNGSGMFTFDLFNIRSNEYVFKYLVNKYDSTPTVIETSNKIYSSDPFLPLQCHLSLTGNKDEMKIIWNSGIKSNNSHQIVEYFIDNNHHSIHSVNQKFSWTYKVDDLCWDTRGGFDSMKYFLDPGFFHEAIIGGLKGDDHVSYRFGTRDGSMSDWNSFIMPDIDRNETKFIVLGDSGTSECKYTIGWAPPPKVGECCPGSKATYRSILNDIIRERDYDFSVHLGDITYAYGRAIYWEAFFHEIEPIASRIPYMAVIGNHDYDWIGQPFDPNWGNFGDDSHGECGVPYFSRFKMIDHLPWYAFDMGPVHIVALSTEHDWTRGSEQYQWIQEDLKSVNRDKQPWIVLCGHRSMYTSTIHVHGDDVVASYMRKELEETLLIPFRINLCLWGHQHNYERTCPLQNNTCKDGYPVHVIAGMGGKNLDGFVTQPPHWSVFRAEDFGYLRIRATMDNLYAAFVNDRDGRVHDSFTLPRRNEK